MSFCWCRGARSGARACVCVTSVRAQVLGAALAAAAGVVVLGVGVDFGAVVSDAALWSTLACGVLLVVVAAAAIVAARQYKKKWARVRARVPLRV